METECGEMSVATDIDRKLCTTAAWLGVATRKELAAAFRRINPATPFDVQRAHKWLQGRATPRGWQIYEDWAKLVALDEPAEWIADCSAKSFFERLCARHGVDPDQLRRRADAFGSAGTRTHQSRDLELVGAYACYSRGWSSYYRGHVIRSTLTITPSPGPSRLHGAYDENLPMGLLQLSGPVIRGERVITVHLGDPLTSTQLFLWLFTPVPPTAVLGGLVSGISLMSAVTQLSTGRLIMIRLPAMAKPSTASACLPKDGSIAEDLGRSGLAIDAPAAVDRAIAAFLGGEGECLDQITAAACCDVVELFDRHWLELPGAAERHDRVVPFAIADRQ